MHFQDSSHEGKAHSCTVGLRVQFIEQAENTVMVLGGNAHAVVMDIEDGFAVLLSQASNLDTGLLLIAHELGGIIEQILENFHQAPAIAIDLREIFMNLHDNAMLRDPAMDQFQGFRHQFIKTDIG
jgi:hypothetical protein